MVQFFYFLTAISSGLGAAVLVLGFSTAKGAPQEAAAAALAIAMAVIPYVFTRCVQISVDRAQQLAALKAINATLLSNSGQLRAPPAEAAPGVGAPVARKE